MPKVIAVFLTFLLCFAGVAGADTFGDWGGQGPGPYLGGGTVDEGDPDCVTVIGSGDEPPAPPVPGGSGSVLCIDARNKPSQIVITFTFTCPVDNGVCVVEYDFSGYNTNFGAGGFDVHVDAGGDFSNADDVWAPIGLPPQSTFGGNTEGAGSCDGATHTITFRVFPGTVLYLDNGQAKCNVSTATESETWGRVKMLFR